MILSSGNWSRSIYFFGNSQCNIDLDTNSILRDSVDKTFLPYSLKLANEKPSDLEISLTVSGGVIGDDLYRIYCHKDTLRIKLYRHSFGYDSLIKDYKYKFDTAIEMKFKNITGQNFVDSLVSLNFFTLKNMDSTMKITRDTLENGSITQILVTDTNNNYVGVVHLHDLIKEGIF